MREAPEPRARGACCVAARPRATRRTPSSTPSVRASRYAASQVHQPTLVEDRSVTIRVVRDGRIGCVSTGAAPTTRRSRRRLGVRPRSRTVLLSIPPSRASLSLRSRSRSTAGTRRPPSSARQQAARAWEAIEAVGELGLYGYFTSGVTELAAASSKGVAVSQATTDMKRRRARDRRRVLRATQTRPRGSERCRPGRSRPRGRREGGRTAGAGDPGPATYRAVLEPYAFGELLWYFGYSSLGALALLEERSYLAGRIGERIFDPAFSLYDDALDPAGLPKAFDFEGVPKRRVAIVEDGVAKDVVWDRRTAARAGRESTGHALVAPAQSYGRTLQPLGAGRRRLARRARVAR